MHILLSLVGQEGMYRYGNPPQAGYASRPSAEGIEPLRAPLSRKSPRGFVRAYVTTVAGRKAPAEMSINLLLVNSGNPSPGA
ncbi:MAG: hypothetical protein M1548_03530 [Actinobacteria bacterium]|nr:hypothetical protein [Actinomycetota bacterium]